MKLLYNYIESCVSNSGASMSYFKIKCGVRQCNPIAAYLFTFAIEILAIEIHENENINGILIDKINN